MARRLPQTGGRCILHPIAGGASEETIFGPRNWARITHGRRALTRASINTRQDQGVSSLAADGQTIYFTGCNRPDGMGNCDIYVADLVGASWQNIRNLGPVVNTEYWESQPSISADGKTLYFASNRPGGMGGTDIWFTTKDVNGNWTEPQDLPAPVNSPDDENSPFISADGVTLYLSSNRKGGLGGFDFYTSEKVDSGWTKPENLGAPINSEHDDEFITYPHPAMSFISLPTGSAGRGIWIYGKRISNQNRKQCCLWKGGCMMSVRTKVLAGTSCTWIRRGMLLPMCAATIQPGSIHSCSISQADILPGTAKNPDTRKYRLARMSR